ncbi:MAG TPA: sugar phosphate isomerase/epimerase, partial [Pirellulales bacterium]
MPRPVTLFTGQWADLKLDDLARKAAEFGYQGLELACWGDHFDVERALSDKAYCAAQRDVLERHDLQVFA